MATTTILWRRRATSTILKNSSRDTWTAEELHVKSNDIETTLRSFTLDITEKDGQYEMHGG
jgi:hypothetical protein